MNHPVSRSMSENLITIDWNEPMEAAHRRMQKARVRHLPVRDDQGEIIGMLSDRDVQRSMVSTVERGWVSSEENIAFDPKARVRDYMSWPALTVDSACEIGAVAERMVREKVSSLLVTRDSRVVGIATADDLLRLLIKLLAEPEAPVRLKLMDLLDDSVFRLSNHLV